MDQVQIGKFIAELRKKKGLTQASLGEKIGVTNKTISRWENGNYMPDISMIPILCSELDVSINEFIAGKYFVEDHYEQNTEELIKTFPKHENLLQKL